MKKIDLYNYVEAKILAQKVAVNKEISDIQQSVKDEIRKNLKGTAFIAQKASVLEEVIDKAIQANVHYQTNSWGIDRHLSYATELISFETNLVDSIYNNVVRDYLNYQSNVATMEKWYVEVKRFIDPLVELYDSKSERRTKLDKLRNELDAVIKSSPSGAKAYKHLVELGVDMTDFKPSDNKSLPVVQKLSEDVCLVNGGC